MALYRYVKNSVRRILKRFNAIAKSVRCCCTSSGPGCCDQPNTLTATMTGCFSGTFTLTKAVGIYSGTLTGFGSFTLSCDQAGTCGNSWVMTANNCPSAVANKQERPVEDDCECRPIYLVFEFIVPASDLACPPGCSTLGVGGAYTITVTE